mmetsp:Transcript_25132/g.57104  ORF Transcript_25132/g.57104 Transcript_25132/m.57104 type:complete len:299 (+) Transcript_25132:85-981(+)
MGGLFWPIALIVCSQLGVLIATAATAECKGPGLAKAHPGVWDWVAGLVLAAVAVDAGVGCCSGWRCGYFMSGWKFSYFMTVFFTGLNVLDLYTDAMAAGSIFASHLCSASQIDSTWLQVLEQSTLPFSVPLWLVAALAFCAGWLQLALGVIIHEGNEYGKADIVGFETIAATVSTPADVEDPARVALKFTLRLLAENVFQLHLQLSTIGLSLALVGWDEAAGTMMGSAAVSAVFLLGKFAQAIPVLTKELNRGGAFVCVVLPGIATLLLVGYAVLKFWALFQCPQHVVNITGCAELEL